MRTTWFCAGILIACSRHAPPVTQSIPQSRTVTGRIVYAASATIDSLRRAHPPTPQMEAFRRRFDSLAALVDTIIVLYPDSIILRVGQAVDMLALIHTQARRASGEILPTYPGFMEVEDMSIAQTREAGLTGLTVGRTRIVLTVMNRQAHAPPSYVVVRVIP